MTASKNTLSPTRQPPPARTSSDAEFEIVLPDLTLPSTGGNVALGATRDQWLLLYFYPRDNTAGCSKEAAQFAERYKKFCDLNVRILGVSRDSLVSHLRFQEKYALPFDLISDHDGWLCAHFDVLKDKIMYGKQVHGIERSTFLIPPGDGRVVKSWRKVKADGHAEEVLKWCGEHAS